MNLDKITADELEGLIVDEKFHVDGPMTVCTLELTSGFRSVGTSAPMNPDNFDEELGRKISRQRAFDKLWELEGYHRMRVATAGTHEEEE